jgi:hypothetical protein
MDYCDSGYAQTWLIGFAVILLIMWMGVKSGAFDKPVSPPPKPTGPEPTPPKLPGAPRAIFGAVEKECDKAVRINEDTRGVASGRILDYLATEIRGIAKANDDAVKAFEAQVAKYACDLKDFYEKQKKK